MKSTVSYVGEHTILSVTRIASAAETARKSTRSINTRFRQNVRKMAKIT